MIHFKMEVHPEFYQKDSNLLCTRFEIIINGERICYQEVQPLELYTDSIIDLIFHKAKDEIKN